MREREVNHRHCESLRASGRKPRPFSSGSVASAQANASPVGFTKIVSVRRSVSIGNFSRRAGGSEIVKYGCSGNGRACPFGLAIATHESFRAPSAG